MKSRKAINKEIRRLEKLRNEKRAKLLGVSDQTRTVASSVQRGMYWGQMAMKAFRTITNYRLSVGKRVGKLILIASSIFALNFIRKKIL